MTQSQDLPRLFDDHGAFVPYDPDFLDLLPATRRALYEDVRAAAETAVAAERDLNDCLDNVKAAADHVAECERAIPKNHTSFMDLWRQNAKGHRQE